MSFEVLPVELIHTLFNYFWCDEIIYSFFGINDYMNSVIYSYSSHRINFQSIIKSDFDKICRLIRGDQIIFLRLSDDKTPDQSNLFLSYIDIERLTRLRSITLIDIDINSLKFILSILKKLKQLRSLSIHCDNILKRYTQIKPVISLIPFEVLIRLDRLNLGHGIKFEGEILPIYLRYLTIKNCTVGDLQMILSKMLELIMLNVCLKVDKLNIGNICASSSLRCLTLKTIDIDSSITMDQIECFLSNLPQLRHLILDLKGQIDLVDGYRWEILSGNLITFNFNFNVELNRVDPILDSFRTPFWLLTKRWYVVYDNKCLFTVPSFAPNAVCVPYYPPIYSTIPDNSIFYNNINRIIVFEPRNATLHRLHNLKELDIRCSIYPKLFFSNVDLSRVKHLKLSSLDNIRSFIMYLKAMPRLSKLSLEGNLKDFVKHVKEYQTEQIRTLKIHTSSENLSYIIEVLIHLFPRIQYLQIATIDSRKDIIRLIDGFEYLSNASFIIKGLSVKIGQEWSMKPELSIRGVRRLTNGTFTCRFNSLCTGKSSGEINLWIGEQIQKPWWIKHFPPRRGYVWYRLMDLLSNNRGIDAIQNIYSTLSFNPIVKSTLKNYIFRLGNSLCLFMKIIYFVYLLVCLLIVIFHFYYHPSITLGFGIFAYIFVYFPNCYRLFINIILFGHRMCMKIFKMMKSSINNRRF